MIKYGILGVALGGFLATSAAQAGDQTLYNGFYARIDGGMVAPSDQSFNSSANSYGVSVTASGSIEYENGTTINAALGRKLNKLLAAEFELGYSKFDYDKVRGTFSATSGGTTYNVVGSADMNGTVSSVTGIANVIYTPFSDKVLSPYVGGGLGLSNWTDELDSIDTLQVNGSESGTDLVANAIAGLDIAFNERLSVGARYRYVWSNTGGNGFDDITAHTFTANLKYDF